MCMCMMIAVHIQRYWAELFALSFIRPPSYHQTYIVYYIWGGGKAVLRRQYRRRGGAPSCVSFAAPPPSRHRSSAGREEPPSLMKGGGSNLLVSTKSLDVQTQLNLPDNSLKAIATCLGASLLTSPSTEIANCSFYFRTYHLLQCNNSY